MMMKRLFCAASGGALVWAIAAPAAVPIQARAPQAEGTAATILPGTPPALPPRQAPAAAIIPGDISLNFPQGDIAAVTKAVLGDILHLAFSVAPGASGPVTVVTARPIARASVLQFFEEAIRPAGFALVERGGRFEVTTISAARGDAPVGGATPGFGNEVIQLKFVGADQMKALLDPVLPGVVAQADAASNAITLSGTPGQRRSARDLLAQFDVNWLRAMSFGLFVPKNTDARLIAPELEKLLNAPDAPTKGLVRLLTMDKLNGILAVSRQPQYLDDVTRWIEILDREGRSTEPKLFVYPVQNGRSRDLARTINAALGNSVGVTDGSTFAGFGGTAETGSAGAARDAAPPQGISRNNEGLGGPSQSLGATPSAGTSAGEQAGASHAGAIITSDDNNNAVIVYGTPRDYALIEDALRKLDVLPVQVMIEAAITEVSLNDNLRYGVQWNFSSGDTSTALTENTVGLAPVRAVPGFSFLFANSTLSAVLNTLETKTKVNVVSAPKLLVLNNQTAALQVGDQVPVLTQSSSSTISGNAPIVNAIEYRDTGVILKVTPRVNATGLVLLDISQEVSDVNTARTTTNGISSPTISTRRISTSVAVSDGEVLALGGLIRNTQSKDRIGLPFLSQLPFIGGLFGRQGTLENKIELIVLLRPRVLRTIDDGRAVTDELRRKIKTLEPFRSTGQIP